MIRVLAPGLISTVQDLGRPGFAHAGVSAAGAADVLSLRAGNRLVGNDDSAAAIEMTLQGGAYLFEEPAVIAITGGEFDCSQPMWTAVSVAANEVVKIGGCRTGARAYLCVRGGIASPMILGSASTHLLSGFGLPLRKGEQLAIGPAPERPASKRAITPPRFRKSLRVTAGAQSEQFSGAAALRLVASTYRVREDCNRQGIRLEGPAIDPPFGGQMISEGVALGAIQMPSSGEPIILFVDAQTTGGYPVIACVISADLSSVAQLRPRDDIRFEPVSLDEARRSLFEQEAWLKDVTQS